jgi:integrase
MASIGKDKGGRKRILFVAGDGSRRTIRMGKANVRQAESLKVKIEALVTGRFTGSIDPETARWIADLPDDMYGRLMAVGLLDPRPKPEAKPQVTVGQLCDQFIESRTDVAKNTKNIFRHTRANLVGFFGADRPLADITEHDADEWRRYLTRERLSEATARKRSGVAKQIVKSAIKQRLILLNPFAELKSGAVGNSERQYFVSRQEAEKVLDACPDIEWRLIFALCRFGGVRCPSEVLALTWADVDWAESRILIHSPKTERHEGKASRWIPLFPELLPHLREAFEQAEPGSKYVITRYRDTNANLRTQLGRIAQRAGLTLWPKPFQNCRSTRETELCETFPEYVVCAWIGNSEKVARRHYLQVTDEHFQRAAQNPAQSAAEMPRKEPQTTYGDDHTNRVLPVKTADCDLVQVHTGEGNTPGKIRTCDLRFRKPMLYPAELRARRM